MTVAKTTSAAQARQMTKCERKVRRRRLAALAEDPAARLSRPPASAKGSEIEERLSDFRNWTLLEGGVLCGRPASVRRGCKVDIDMVEDYAR